MLCNFWYSFDTFSFLLFKKKETGDHVKCFCCDGALRNWEPKDDPWVEHARWFSRCNFLVSVKGNDYIKEIQARYQVNIITACLHPVRIRIIIIGMFL